MRWKKYSKQTYWYKLELKITGVKHEGARGAEKS
jgi:hypothetical protein